MFIYNSTFKFSLAFFLLVLCSKAFAQTTYYSEGSLAVNDVNNWNTQPDGLGSSPGAFGTNNTWIIQNGHSMTLTGTSTWNVGSNGVVTIQNGGTWTNNSSGAVTIGTFNIHGGGTYVHNSGNAIVPGTTRNFANSTNGGNGNGTYEIQNYGTSSIPSSGSVTWGNVRVNRGTTTQAVGHTAGFANIEGNFVMDAHGAHEFRFTAAQTTTHSISGNLEVNGGSINFKSGAGNLPINIGGNLTITGGTLTQTSGTSTVSFTGAAGEYTFSNGTFTTTLMNFSVNNGATTTFNSNLVVNASRSLTVSGRAIFTTNAVVSGAGTFTLASGGTLTTANSQGINSTGSNGSIQTTTRAFNSGGNYEFQSSNTGTFTTTPTSSTVNNLTINNSGGNILLGQSLSVGGTLALSAGILDLNGASLSFNTITGVPAWGSNATSYIIATSGLLTKTNPASTIFPIGTASYYLPCRLTGSGTFSVQLTSNTMPDDPTSTLPSQWTITGPGGSFTPEFQWPGAAEGANMSANRSNLYLFKVTGGVTTSYGPESAAGGDPYTISFGSVPCCSDFIVGAESTFPVELISFKAKKVEDGVELDWKTASEINNDYFSVERSSDGNVFREIGSMPGNGTSFQTNSYSFIDQAPAPGLNYYRLRQVDFNGNYSVSGMVSVKIGTETGLVKLYPTSASSEVNIQLPVDLEESASVQIIGLDGKRIHSFHSEPGRTLVKIPLDAMSNGIYFVKIVFGNNTQTLQFVKQ